MTFSISFVVGSKSAEGGKNPLADMDSSGELFPVIREIYE